MVFVDYGCSEKCNNPDTYGMICVKCGECGRKFNKNGICTNIDDYPTDTHGDKRVYKTIKPKF